MTITLFGPMSVLVRGQQFPRLRSRKTLWLLALLVLRHGRAVEREWIAGTLWPDIDQANAFANLRPVLSELRRALGAESARLQAPSVQTLLLDLHGAFVDLVQFDNAIARKKPESLQLAVSLYRGPLLEGCTEEWVHQDRAAREQDSLKALQSLAEDAASIGDHSASADYWKQAMRLDPWLDTVQRGLMSALSQSGDNNAALRVYRDFAAVLRSESRTVPDDRTTALYKKIRQEMLTKARTVTVAPNVQMAAVPSVTGYLPHALTDLVGREDERLDVAARLRRARLVTLTGPGGIGKTRLAIEVAAEVAPTFPDGVWLVALDALDSLSDSSKIARQIATVFGLREDPSRPILQLLCAHLRAKRLLLVLDNCEHLIESAAQVAVYLLKECNNLRILTTSREALGITGEVSWAVPALAVPDPFLLPKGSSALQKMLPAFEGVQLFIERAQSVSKAFNLTRENALSIANVCAQLQGIPLAIELAAARTTVMTPEQIAARLSDHLGLLSRGSRVVVHRQQTLRATLDWSYKLLSRSETVLLGRLSVFAGGWNLEAAEWVCAGDGIDEAEILNLLTSLANKSLVVFEELPSAIQGEYVSRYRLLEMVRQYAADWISKTPSASQRVKSRHRDFFLKLAKDAEPHLKSSEQQLWLGRLEQDIDNLRLALGWSIVENVDAEAALQMCASMWQFWELRGYYGDGRLYLSESLAKPGAENRTRARAVVLSAAGVFAYYQGDYVSSRSLSEEGLAVFREIGDKRGIAWTLKDLGRLAGAQGDFSTAKNQYEESLAISRQIGDLQASGWSLNDLGNLATSEGNYTLATKLHEESMEISRQLGDTEGIAWSYHHLGGVARAQGDFERSTAMHSECLAIFQQLGNKQGTAWSLDYLGILAGFRRDYDAAVTAFEEALTLFRELGNKQGVAWTLYDYGALAAQHGYKSIARGLLRQCLFLQQELGDKRGVSAALRAIAGAALPTSIKAARLRGASEALRESLDASLPPSEQSLFDEQVAESRAALGEAAFMTAWEEGVAMTPEAAAAYALASTDDDR